MNNGKRFVFAALLFCALGLWAAAQQPDVFDRLSADSSLLDGTDRVCPTGPVALTPAPRGYKPFYISHYSRHGARYASQSDLYGRIHEVLTKASEEENLTPSGQDFQRRFEGLYPEVRYRTGDLSKVGWDQQQALAARMYANFPAVFPAGADVQAWTSTSTRCVMTMSSFCLGLKGCSPKLDLVEHFGKVFLPAILPQDSGNPFRDKNYPRTPLSFEESLDHYIARTLDYKPILSRLFVDPDKAVKPKKQWDFVSYLWFFSAGMNSLETDLDFHDLFTQEELVALWKIDDFQFYSDAWPGHLGYLPILDDIIAKADARIAEGRTGADLRFGHDYTLLPLLMILDVDGIGHDVADPDEIPVWFQTYRIPMGANVYFVFYRSKRDARILFKVLLNGEEARLPLDPVEGPYYDWAAFKAGLAQR